MRCQNCGKMLPDDSVFCDGCGMEVNPSVPFENHVQAKHWAAHGNSGSQKRSVPKGAKIAIGTIAAAALVCLGGVGGYFFAKSTLPEFMGVTFVNAASFPDGALREAVSRQLDSNHDGMLSNEERRSAVSLKATPLGIEFNADAEAALPGIDPMPGNAPEWSGLENVSIGFAGIERLPELQKVECGGVNVESVDFSGNPKLEYVDLRGSDISSIDLSNNKEITTVLCDPSVQITGLSESGLYFTDLITTVNLSEPNGDKDLYWVDYDEKVRPIAVQSKLSTTEYRYDDFGRLASAGIQGSTPSYTFEYDGSGRLASMVDNLQTGRSRGSAQYSYDEAGMLVATSIATTGSITSRTYEYADGKLASMTTEGQYEGSLTSQVQKATLTYDGEHATEAVTVFETMSSGGSTMSSAVGWRYDDTGRLIAETYSDVILNRQPGTPPGQYATIVLDEQGFPTSLTRQVGGNDMVSTAQISCNADGYIETLAIESSPGSVADGMTITVGYVKRVGSLEDRAKDAYVPKVGIDLGIGGWNAASVDDGWFASEAIAQFVASISMRDAAYVPFDSIDPVPMLGLSSNELALRAYDREMLQGRAPAVFGDAPENAQQNELPSDEGEEAAQSFKDEERQASEQASSASIDLSDPETYQSVNQYLSNFTESAFAMSEPYDSSAPQDGDTIGGWVTEFCRVNRPDVVETSLDNDYEIPGPGGGGVQGVYNMRIPIPEASDAIERYLGVNFDEAIFDGAYFAYDGWLYFGVTAPALANGIALAMSASDAGNGQVRVEYDVYRSDSPYDALDASLYAMSADELLSELDGGKLFASGEAVIEPTVDGGFKLVSMRTVR